MAHNTSNPCTFSRWPIWALYILTFLFISLLKPHAQRLQPYRNPLAMVCTLSLMGAAFEGAGFRCAHLPPEPPRLNSTDEVIPEQTHFESHFQDLDPITPPNRERFTLLRKVLVLILDFWGALKVRQPGSVKESTNCAKKKKRKNIADFSHLSCHLKAVVTCYKILQLWEWVAVVG